MRKLILTSFSAKTGELEFTEQRLVVIDSDKHNTSDEDRELASEVFKGWFGKQYPESELLSVIPHETVKHYVYNDRWSDFNTPPRKNPEDDEISVNVIININGEGEFFDTGWYDYNDKKWVNCNRDFDRAIEMNPEKQRWSYPVN